MSGSRWSCVPLVSESLAKCVSIRQPGVERRRMVSEGIQDSVECVVLEKRVRVAVPVWSKMITVVRSEVVPSLLRTVDID
jgi:hypothetical protein